MLLRQPPGWLTAWAAGLEEQGCVAPGEGPALATRVAQSLPLDPAAAFHLLYSSDRQTGQVDLAPPMRLQVVSPILNGAAAPEEPAEIAGSGNSLTVTAKAPPNLIGYETAWYSVGHDIAPLYAELHIQGKTERRPQPSVNYLHFPPEAAFYRLLYKSSDTGSTAIVLAAPTRAALDRQTRTLDGVAIPRGVAINPMIPVTINGAEVMVNWGGNVGEAIRSAGERQPQAVLPKLSVSRLYNGRLAPVVFDHASPAILGLMLTGRETISWELPQAPPGTLVDVGGYRVHLYCTGTGSPTVVIAGGFSFDWALVQPAVAQFTRVCTYDASGIAWSDPGPEPTCSTRVEEIHRLLVNAKIEGPYVLAGLSTGALFARLYAKHHPDEVAAMVLIDHAYLPARAAPPPVISGPDSPPAVISATPIEIGVEDEPGFNQLPEHIRALHLWAMSRNPRLPTAEMAEGCIAALGNANLGNLPLTVVSTANDSPGYLKLQANLLALSRHSNQLIAEKSFHSIEISRPEIVIQAIRQAVEATRK